jgi:hypothetical protein
MRQGFAKRPPAEKGSAIARAIKTLETALAGKSGYQSPWAIAEMTRELAALKAHRSEMKRRDLCAGL